MYLIISYYFSFRFLQSSVDACKSTVEIQSFLYLANIPIDQNYCTRIKDEIDSLLMIFKNMNILLSFSFGFLTFY